jgi:hypothetical protein
VFSEEHGHRHEHECAKESPSVRGTSSFHFFGLLEIQQMLGPLQFFRVIAKYPNELCLMHFHLSHFVLCMVLYEFLLHNFSCFVF